MHSPGNTVPTPDDSDKSGYRVGDMSRAAFQGDFPGVVEAGRQLVERVAGAFQGDKAAEREAVVASPDYQAQVADMVGDGGPLAD